MFKYLAYAVGEIILVVAGILIALQINNMNDAAKNHEKKIHYLKGIKTDLQTNIQALNKYIDNRNNIIKLARTILEYSDGTRSIADLSLLNQQCIQVYIWKNSFTATIYFRR